MLRAFGQLLHNISQHDPTMLQYVALKCFVHLAGPLERRLIKYKVIRNCLGFCFTKALFD